MAIQIPCPKCGAFLKLPDRSLLGRKGKCPKCGHRFTLTEPEEVELELAEASASQPLKVPAARRVADDDSTPSSANQAAHPSIEIPSFDTAGPVASGTARLHDLNRRRQRQRRNGIMIGAVLAIAVAGATWAGANYLRSRPQPAVTDGKEPPKANPTYVSERDRLERLATLIDAESLTHGKPVTLKYVPAGASIVLHLRPAALWKPGSIGEETRFCLGDEFKEWSEALITKYCLLAPAEIEEATICLILESRGSEPQVATVVRPVTPEKTSDLMLRFGSQPEAFNGTQVFVGAERAYLIGSELDDKKRPTLFATAPARMAEDLALSKNSAGITSDAIRQILEQTDRERLATIVFQPSDLEIHAEALFRSDLRPLATAALDWLGKDAESVAWSMHAAGKEFESELIVRNDPATTPPQVVRTLTKQFDRLPEELVAKVSKMSPADVGDRKLIGRLPAMTQLFAAATVAGIDQRKVVLQTRLPERAAPNLALAGLLTWLESMRTPSASAPSPGEATATPMTLAQKLQKPVEVDFRRTPFEDAFAFIGEETGIDFEIDGDALKLAAYTRNMEQNISIGRVSGEKAIAAIAAQYDKLALVVDEANGRIIVTTIAAATEKGLTPTTFTP